MAIKHENQAGMTLVLGATGKTGRRVLRRLEDKGVPVRSGSRAGPLPFEWNDRATWGPVLEGVVSVYIVYVPDLAVPGAAETIQQFVDQAVEAGVRHLVLLSGRGEEEAQRCERIVQNAGVDWTILRVSWFSQNFSEAFLRDMVVAGVVALPAGAVAEPFIDVEDIAEVAATVLTEPGHEGQLYELTGPRLLTFPEAVAEIARATGRQIRFLPISHQAFVADLEAQQVPGDLLALLGYLFREVLDGRNASLTDGVQRVLGRPAGDFSDYVRGVGVEWKQAA